MFDGSGRRRSVTTSVMLHAYPSGAHCRDRWLLDNALAEIAFVLRDIRLHPRADFG